MRFSTVAILTLAVLAVGKPGYGQEAIADPPSERSQLGGTIQLSNPQWLAASDFEGAFVRDVVIRFVNGDGNTRDSDGRRIRNRISEDFIRDELRLLSDREFSEEIVRSDLQQLHQLGLFRKVTVTIEEVGSGDVIVYYNIQESPAVSYRAGGGINSDVGVFVDLGYTNRSIGTTAQRFDINLTGSTKDLEYDLSFTSPYLAGPDNLGYTLGVWRDRRISRVFDGKVDLPNGDDARDRRFGGGIVFNRPVGNWQGEFGLSYERISIRDEDSDLAKTDARGNPTTWSRTGIDDLYVVSLGLSRSWQDNPFEPTAGATLAFTTEQSIPIGVGEITRNRLKADYVQYVPVRIFSKGDPDLLPEMFAFNIQLGTIIGDLPPQDAFALGGDGSVRGYEPGDLGTGRSFVSFSGEYRFPVLRDVGAVLFADFASDLGSADAVLGKPAEVRDKPGTGFGGGLGLRVRTFLGLLRVDVGFSDEGSVQFYFGTGQTF